MWGDDNEKSFQKVYIFWEGPARPLSLSTPHPNIRLNKKPTKSRGSPNQGRLKSKLILEDETSNRRVVYQLHLGRQLEPGETSLLQLSRPRTSTLLIVARPRGQGSLIASLWLREGEAFGGRTCSFRPQHLGLICLWKECTAHALSGLLNL